jgi:phosphoribosylformylglycinamidine synthase
MSKKVRRIFVEKKMGFNVEASGLLSDLKQSLFISSLKSIRILNRYDISGITDEEYKTSVSTIFSEVPVDIVYEENLPSNDFQYAFAVEYLPGQYDQRADSAAECVQLLTQGERPNILSAKVILIYGDISKEDFNKIKNYYINPVDSREASMDKPDALKAEIQIPLDIGHIDGFINMNDSMLVELMESLGLAMNIEDLKFCRKYFRNEECRNPTITEIRAIDTYWSDHCRHTTFLTELQEIEIEEGVYAEPIRAAYEDYLKSRQYVYEGKDKPVTLMDIAVIGMKELRKKGLLQDLDLSEEINACSIKVTVDVDGKDEEWLVMFKNETHNHPTEIEPFGGAATCLGGAIRDPLSGRSYVYQAMRVTGSGDPRTKIEHTLPGKLPQRKISTIAAQGYSSYGNQIGLATGQVSEVYDPGFVAKRMEVGAVIAAVPAENVVRKIPEKGDKIILLGGRTGRDGCGGATGSSKQHTEESILNCGAEVQKGNAPTERKLQRLFRNPKVSKLIKRCNDFGAGGVSVAIGELAPGLEINLDRVPKKYEGLDGTELAISESQERMAVVVSAQDVEKFITYSNEENLEAIEVAEVNDSNRLTMLWRGRKIVDISRSFLDTNGARAYAAAVVKAPTKEENYFNAPIASGAIKEKWINTLADLNVCSQKGLSEIFDSTIGSGTVLMPFGGRKQLTPSEGMAAKMPLLKGETKTGTLMTYGYNPKIANWSPFHGALYAVVEAVTKIAVLGGDYKKIRLSLQEYFERLEQDKTKWGKPLSALLGALHAQRTLGIPAIGGKDSMSGSFKELHVPPTVVAFAVCPIEDCDKVISQEFKKAKSNVVVIKTRRDDKELPDFDELKLNLEKLQELISKGFVLAASSIKQGGICEAVSKMSFGNELGFNFNNCLQEDELFSPAYGSVVVELSNEIDLEQELKDINYTIIGTTVEKPIISFKNTEIKLQELLQAWESTLEDIFPTKTKVTDGMFETELSCINTLRSKASFIIAKPRVFIPVFPGTNCEYDSARAFEKAGGSVKSFVFKNLTSGMIEESLNQMVKEINNANIVMLPGGFSAGDEPDGSGKFIATVFRNPRIKEAVMELLNNRDGLMLGICNGFQALIKLGLLPYGEIRDLDEDSPTLTYNEIGRHISTMVNTKIVSKLSPWFNNALLGDIHSVAVSHGEGRFVGTDSVIEELFARGQVAAQYVDSSGNAVMDMPYNPNGSYKAIEAITSPDGRILGKMAHSERIGENVHKNVPGNKHQGLFQAGIDYFR